MTCATLGVNTECQGHYGYYCCLTNYPTCSCVKQQQFYCVHGVSESGIQNLVSSLWYQGPQLGRGEDVKVDDPLAVGCNYTKAYSLIYLAPGLGGPKDYLWMSSICALTCSLQGNFRGLGLLTWRLKASSTTCNEKGGIDFSDLASEVVHTHSATLYQF